MNRVLEIVTVIALIITALACGKKPASEAAKGEVVKGVKVDKVGTTLVDDFYEAVGTVRAKSSSVIAARIMGAVIRVRVKEGDRVRAGQPLIEIESRDLVAQVDRARASQREAQEALEETSRSLRAAEAAKAAAEANRDLAAATFRRYQVLLERKSVSPQEFDEVQARHRVAAAEADRAARMLEALEAKKGQVEARIEQAKAGVAAAETALGYARIVAPEGGIVVAKHVDEGTMASPGVPLLTIDDDSRYRLEASVEESRIGSVRLGESAQVRIDALGDKDLAAKVVEIVPVADPGSRSYTVRLELPATAALRSGLYGRARFVAGQKSALVVPRSAIFERGQLVGLYVVDQGDVARLRLVKLGRDLDGGVEVLAGLSEGERIVVDRVQSVSDGSRIEQR